MQVEGILLAPAPSCRLEVRGGVRVDIRRSTKFSTDRAPRANLLEYARGGDRQGAVGGAVLALALCGGFPPRAPGHSLSARTSRLAARGGGPSFAVCGRWISKAVAKMGGRSYGTADRPRRAVQRLRPFSVVALSGAGFVLLGVAAIFSSSQLSIVQHSLFMDTPVSPEVTAQRKRIRMARAAFQHASAAERDALGTQLQRLQNGTN
eukprot:SAG31_NODE_464_length_15318_cov_17.930876_13_plen_207_part_00